MLYFVFPAQSVPPTHQAIMKYKLVRWEAVCNIHTHIHTNACIKNSVSAPMQCNREAHLLFPYFSSNMVPQPRESKGTRKER